MSAGSPPMTMDQQQETAHYPPPRYSPPGYFSEQIQSAHNNELVLAAAPMYGEVSPPLGPPVLSRSPLSYRLTNLPETTNMFYIRSFSPFARAYSPALAQLPEPISQDEFLAFIDGLNGAYMMHPFFQASFVSGGFVMAAPLLPVQAAGGAVQAISAIASAAVTVVRARKYLKNINETMFKPRGLAVKIMETKKMMQAVGAAETKLKLPPLDDVNDLDPMGQRQPGQELPDQWLKRKAGGPGRWLNSKNIRGLDKVRGKGMKKQQERANELAGELAEVNAEVQELERLAHAQELVEMQLLENHKGRPAQEPAQAAAAAIGDRQIDHELAAGLARRDALMDEIRRAGEGKMKKADKKEERIANRILRIVITHLDGTPLGDDDFLVDTPSEQSSIA
ncbi:hypothetical protein IWX90DRAFT_475982 [Phyllosticta citrichinensis]|uniref:Uncharacterized protein n=1 Tax=Phyllosticta citrichinensis TaxID=1130410 RepID=A0ABR1XYB8_9PEZI